MARDRAVNTGSRPSRSGGLRNTIPSGNTWGACSCVHVRLTVPAGGSARLCVGVCVSFDVIGGDFGKGSGFFGFRSFTLPTGQWGSKEEVPTYLLQSVELISQETIQKHPNRLAWGLGGAALMGPLGLLTGLLPRGSTHNKVAFVAEFTDGRSFLATTDHKTYLKIKAASVGSRSGNVGAALHELQRVDYPKGLSYTDYMDADAIEHKAIGKPSIETYTLSNKSDPVEQFLEDDGWQVRREEILESDSLSVFVAKKHGKTLLVVSTPSILDIKMFKHISDETCRVFAHNRIFIAKSVVSNVFDVAKSLGITVGPSQDLYNLIPE
jgi:hypothetical protein